MTHNVVIHKLFRKPLFIAGSTIAVMFVLLCLFGPALSPNDPLKTNIEKSLAPPSGEYPLGCDELGRCILSRLISGARITLGAAIATEAAILVIGILAGLAAGYFSSLADTIMLIIIDILLAFPGIILALVISGLLGAGLGNLLIALIAVYWVEHARIARSMTRFVKEKEFVLSARALGCGDLRIIRVHILPNILPNMLVYSTLNISSVIMSISSLSFIGLGVKPPAPEWGMLLSEGRVYMRENPLMIIAAIACIVLSSACAQMLGESFRDVLNPRQSHLNNRQKNDKANIKNIKIETIEKTTNKHTLLTVENLTICFPSPHGFTQVLKNFNLELAEGQTLGIMGHSGCGKTVFCSSLLGMVERPGFIESGTICYAPYSSSTIDLISLNEKQWRGIRGKEISMIFQDPMQALNNSRTIEKQFVEAVLAHKTMKKI
jgi:peptide/nickel transport system permease protein